MSPQSSRFELTFLTALAQECGACSQPWHVHRVAVFQADPDRGQPRLSIAKLYFQVDCPGPPALAHLTGRLTEALDTARRLEALAVHADRTKPAGP